MILDFGIICYPISLNEQNMQGLFGYNIDSILCFLTGEANGSRQKGCPGIFWRSRYIGVHSLPQE